MSADGFTWEGWIEQLRDQGYSADEIVDYFDRYTAQEEARTGRPDWYFSRTGEMLFWGTLHDRRRILRMIESLTGSREVSAAEVRAKRDELRAAGKPHGVRSLARACGISEMTVRRRLGRVP
jgi:DNA-binding transcriptional MerR regulator